MNSSRPVLLLFSCPEHAAHCKCLTNLAKLLGSKTSGLEGPSVPPANLELLSPFLTCPPASPVELWQGHWADERGVLSVDSEAWLRILTLLLTSRVTLGKSVHLFVFLVLLCREV